MASRPIRKRKRPELTETQLPVAVLMLRAGFRRKNFSAVQVTDGRYYSAVTRDTPDDYYYHPITGQNCFVESKRRRGGRVSAGQLAFRAAHAIGPTPVLIWHDPAQCEMWLQLRAYLVDGRYPFGLHRVRPESGVTTFDELMAD